MAVQPRTSTELLIPNKWSDDEERRNIKSKIGRKVAVIYYLMRNGHLEHPHFIEIPMSSSYNGLYLKDVINKLNSLRGNGMPYLYSWSSKRSYKNGYVWQDLSDNDLIHPTNGHEYVLKGSELLLQTPTTTTNTIIDKNQNNSSCNTDEDRDAPSSINTVRMRKNRSWSSFENNVADDRREYAVVYKCESSREFAGADAATQTEEKKKVMEVHKNKSVELNREELSPPLSMSSSDGSDGVSGSGNVNDRDRMTHNKPDSVGKLKSWMQRIACGSSLAIKHYVPMKRKEYNMKIVVKSGK